MVSRESKPVTVGVVVVFIAAIVLYFGLKQSWWPSLIIAALLGVGAGIVFNILQGD